MKNTCRCTAGQVETLHLLKDGHGRRARHTNNFLAEKSGRSFSDDWPNLNLNRNLNPNPIDTILTRQFSSPGKIMAFIFIIIMRASQLYIALQLFAAIYYYIDDIEK